MHPFRALILCFSILVANLLFTGFSSSYAQSIPESGSFDPVAVVNGIRINRSACATLEKNETAIWMNGAVLGPKGKNADRRQKGFGPVEMIGLEQRLSSRFGVPSIFLGRPGTYGSAGKHFAVRGRPAEAQFISAALDGIKKRYGIQTWALGGHSGGGTLVAEMLARRDDIRCAVISSGASAYRAYLEARGLTKPGEPTTRFDPYTSLHKIPFDPQRRVFVIGDPRETNVPFSSQKLYFDGLVARGHAAWLVPLERATDRRHHNLVDFGETANGMCAAGAHTDSILQTLNTMPQQLPRLTN